MCVVIIRICFLSNDTLIGFESFCGIMYMFLTIPNLTKYVKYFILFNIFFIIFFIIVVNYIYVINIVSNAFIIAWFARKANRPNNRITIPIVPILILVPLNSEDDLECCICLEKGKEDFVALKCAHSFHKNCILKWCKEKQICPMCRIEI